jgi:hypothetical protein
MGVGLFVAAFYIGHVAFLAFLSPGFLRLKIKS